MLDLIYDVNGFEWRKLNRICRYGYMLKFLIFIYESMIYRYIYATYSINTYNNWLLNPKIDKYNNNIHITKKYPK